MTREEVTNATIDTYMNLQCIKKANGDHDNPELNYQIKDVISKLSSYYFILNPIPHTVWI